MADSPKEYAFTLGSIAGIKRDGQNFESQEYTDGVWCRFQRDKPRKMGGMRSIFKTTTGIPRGMITQSIDGTNYVTVGTAAGIEFFSAGTSDTAGVGPYTATINTTYGQTAISSVTNQTTFVVSGSLAGLFAVGATISFSQSGSPTFIVQSSTVTGTAPNEITTVVTTVAFTGTPTTVWVINTTKPFVASNYRLWQFDVQNNGATSSLQLLAHGGNNLLNIDSNFASPVYYGNILPTNNTQWSLFPMADTTGQNPTGRIISVSGGVASGYPYTFVYGDAGFIANNHVDQSVAANLRTNYFTDWNGATANQINVAAGKIVKMMPIRGGTASPSMLAWATDSIIRVSFSGQAPYYWQYDLIASKISVMSSNSIIQADGAIYWMGVDRFYVYNGSVKVLPNEKNINYLIDNINYAQRQKVHAQFIPRFSEIWWFYPRGNSEECNDVIIFNTEKSIWYDTGQAIDSRRSCGYTTEVFPRPIFAGYDPKTTIVTTSGVIAQPSGLPAPTPTSFYVAGNQTSGFANGNFVSLTGDANLPTSFRITSSVYQYSSTYDATLVSLATAPMVTTLPVGTTVWGASSSGYTVWEHENGTDRIDGSDVSSIYSRFETTDISWCGGTPSQDAAQGVDRTMTLWRVEPNFTQIGEMIVTPVGRGFASSQEVYMSPQSFNPDTKYIDFGDVDFRQLRLRFESDATGGHYEMGRMLLKVDYGTERPND